MKCIHILLAGLMFLPVTVRADENENRQVKPRTDANITGHVVRAGTHEHIPYITITIKGTTIGTVTDATGHYFLKDIPEGDFTIVASGIGYMSVEQKIKMVGKQTLEVNFDLEEQAVGMDEVVVSSSRNETNKKTSSSIVNVLSGKVFETTSSNNLTETMGFQAGLRIENNCSNCGTTQLRINGLEGQYSQILLDSRPIFSSLAGVYGLEQLPVAMVERVEVIRGGGSALFGANAIGGVVNIITKEPLRNTFSLSNTTNIIDKNSLDNNTALNAAFVSDDHKAGVYLFGMIRNRDPYDRNGDGFSNIPKIKSETIGFRGYYKTSTYSKLTAEYHHIHEFRRGGDRIDSPPHEALIAEQLDHHIDDGGLKFDWFTPDYNHRLGLYASAQKVARDSYFGTDMNPDAYGNTEDLTFVGGSQYTYAFDRAWFAPAELTAGLEFTHNGLHDIYKGYDRDLKQITNIVGAFAQNEWKTDRFNFLVGGRLDKHNLMKNAVFSPRANARYSPSENVGLRLSYASGYRAPQAYDEDLHVDAVGGTVALIELDPDLKPEYSHSVSASADLYRNFGRLQTNLLLEGFYTRLNDVFALVQYDEGQDGDTEYRRYIRVNADGAVVTGLNTELKMGIPAVFDIQIGYTFQKSRYTKPFRWSEDLDPQKRMFRSPDHYGYFTANWDVVRNFKASLFGNVTGPMLVQHVLAAYDTSGEVEETETEKYVRGFFDMGVKLAYNFRLSAHCNLELSGGVKNIFDQYQKDLDYGPLKDAAYVYGPTFPRIYFVGVKFYMQDEVDHSFLRLSPLYLSGIRDLFYPFRIGSDDLCLDNTCQYIRRVVPPVGPEESAVGDQMVMEFRPAGRPVGRQSYVSEYGGGVRKYTCLFVLRLVEPSYPDQRDHTPHGAGKAPAAVVAFEYGEPGPVALEHGSDKFLRNFHPFVRIGKVGYVYEPVPAHLVTDRTEEIVARIGGVRIVRFFHNAVRQDGIGL